MARNVAVAGHKVGAKGEGKLVFPNRKKFDLFTKSLGDGVRVICEIREDESHLITSHRGYYHAIVVKHVAIAMRDVGGYTIDPKQKAHLDMVHEWLRDDARFLNNGVTITNSWGQSIKMGNSTKRLDDDGWKDFLTNIIVFVAEVWGYAIPAKMAQYYFPTEEPKFLQYREIQSRIDAQNGHT